MPVTPFVDDGDYVQYVGDALEVLRGLPDASVDAVVTDPPYGQTSLAWDVQPREWLPLVDRVLKPTGSVWIFGSLRSFMVAAEAREFEGWKFAQDIVWEKHNGSNFHADRFRRVHEQAAHFYRGKWVTVWKAPQTTPDARRRKVSRKERPPHTGHIETSTYVSEDGGPRLQRSVMYVRSCHGHADHETQKPEGILRPLIAYSCPPGGVVLDPFGGSGTTALVARELGRKSVLIELNPTYAELAARRLQQLGLFAEAAS